MKKKIIFGILIIIGIISLFIYENIELYHKVNMNNFGISEYGSGNYLASQLIFSGAQVLENDPIFEYNKANSLYKLGAETNNIQEKIDLFQQSIQSYSGSLSLESNTDAQENIIYIEKILEQFKEKEKSEDSSESEDTSEQNNSQENSGDDNSESNTSSGAENTGENTEGNTKNETEENSNPQEGDSGEETATKEEGSTEKSSEESINETETNENELSDETTQQIEKYIEQLKQSEAYNQKYFNKKSQETTTDVNDFFRDPFFEDGFVRGEEKDW